MGAAYAALLIFTAIYFLQPSDWIPGLSRIPLGKITGVLALAACVLGAMGYGGLRVRLPREAIYLIVLFCQLCGAVAFSPVWRGGAFQIVVLEFSKVVLMTIVLVVTVTTWSRFRKLIILQVMCIGTITLVSLHRSIFLGGRLVGSLSDRFSNSNDLALLIDLVVPFVIALQIGTRSILKKTLWSLLSCALAYTVLLTSSRGGLLTLLVAVGISLWEFGVKGPRKALLFFAALGISALLFAALTTRTGERVRAISDPYGDESAYESARQRREIFWRSVQVTAEHPFFGVGSGNFAELSGSWHVAHNSFTELSAEGGILALFLFLLMLWRSFRNLRYARLSASDRPEMLTWIGALRASLTAFMVGACFGSYEYHFLTYFLIAYTSVLYRISGAFGASRPSAGRNFGATSV
jgi:O-antigen ligase